MGLVSNVLPFQDLGTGLTGRKPSRSGCGAMLPLGTPPSTERERAPSPHRFPKERLCFSGAEMMEFSGVFRGPANGVSCSFKA